MKKMTVAALITLLTVSVHGAEFRDAVFQGTSKTAERLMDVSGGTYEITRDVADLTAEQLKAIISKSLEATAQTSQSLGEIFVKVAEVSKPMFKFTSEGIALAFEVTGNATEATGPITEKILIKLEPTSEVSSEVLSDVLEAMSNGTSEASELISDILKFLSEKFHKPLELSTMTIEQLFDLLGQASEASTKVSNAVVGKDNLVAGLELTGRGIELTSEGISNLFYLLSKGTTAISNIFETNNMDKEDIERAVDNGDQEVIDSVRELLRQDIENRVQGGDLLNKLLTDEDIDVYRDLLLLKSSK